MKKNDSLILIATSAYSYLFYEQCAGINFFLFNIILIALLWIQNNSLFKSSAWLIVATGSLVSSFFVFWWGTWLPVLANICSLLALTGLSFVAESSFLIAIANSCFSTFTAIPLAIVQSRSKTNVPDEKSIFRKLPLLIIPVFITLVFLFLYRGGNPVFEKFTNEINLDFISAGWIFFTLAGFVLMFGVFHHQIMEAISKKDKQSGDLLPLITLEEHSSKSHFFSISNELLTGIISFLLLNLLLFSVNALDVYFMWVVQKPPEGITIAEYLHDGTNILILSIVFAISIILFFFRGYLNFYENNRWLKLAAYGWLFQNALLVITTAHRNWWIIESTGLTRKRIGVYLYLLLCLIGLTTTLTKVASKKSNWFLIRKNSWAFYGVFIATCFPNWDNIIVTYNCKNYKLVKEKYMDRRYQSELSHTSLASLFRFYEAEKTELNPMKRIFSKEIESEMFHRYYELKEETETASWKSYCRSKESNVEAIDEMISKQGAIR